MQDTEDDHDVTAGSRGVQKKSNIIVRVLFIAVFLIFLGLAGYKWHSQIQEYKANINMRNLEISELTSQLAKLKQQNTTGTAQATSYSIEQDAEKIHTALLAVCNKDAAQAMKYLVPDGRGGSVEKITPAILKLKNTSGDSQYVQSSGFAAIGIGCRSIKPVEEEGGGFVSILKRQTDGSWSQIIGTQQGLACSFVDQHKIPKEIQPSCDSGDGRGTPRANTN